MTLAELKAMLADFGPEFDDMIVLKSKDEEGNAFNQVTEVDPYLTTEDASAWEVESILDGEEAEDYEDDELTQVLVIW